MSAGTRTEERPSRTERTKLFVRAVVADFGEGELLVYASSIAFRVLFAVIPFALFAIALLGFLGLQPAWDAQIGPSVRAVAGDPVFGLIDGTVRQVLASRQVFWLTAGLLVTVWEIWSAVSATGGAVGRIYHLRDDRPLKRYTVVTVLLSIAVAACLLVAAFAIFFGAPLAEALLGPSVFAAVVGFVARWAVALGAMLLAVGLLLRHAPGGRVDWRWAGTGAFVTVVVWAVASAGFAAYVSWVVNYASTFGGLALPFVVLVYLYVATTVFLFGVWIERRERTGCDRPVMSPPDGTEEEEDG